MGPALSRIFLLAFAFGFAASATAEPTPEERLKRCVHLLEPKDLRGMDLDAILAIRDADLRERLLKMKAVDGTGPSRWDPAYLPQYLHGHLQVSAELTVTAEELGWSLVSAKRADRRTYEFRVRHRSGEERVLRAPWEEAMEIRERLLLDAQVEFREAPVSRLRRLLAKREGARKRRDRLGERESDHALRALRQSIRATESLPAYFAAWVAKAARAEAPRLGFLQRAYYETLFAPELRSLLKSGDRRRFSARAVLGSPAFLVGSARDLDGKLAHRVGDFAVELEFSAGPAGGVSVPEDLELSLFLEESQRWKGGDRFAAALKMAGAAGFEFHYLDAGKMGKVERGRRELADFLRLRREYLDPAGEAYLREAELALPEFYRELPGLIRKYVSVAYRDAKKGLAVSEADLARLLEFMRQAEERTEYFALLKREGKGKREIVGTLSLVSSASAAEPLPLESVTGVRIARSGDLPIVEISRYALDFSARRAFSSRKFLRSAYFAAASRPIQKVVAFCEQKFAETVIAESRGAFKVARSDLVFEGKRYFLLEADPADLLEKASEPAAR